MIYGATNHPLRPLTEEIKASGYDQTITLEVFSPDRDYLAVSLQKVRTVWDSIPSQPRK